MNGNDIFRCMENDRYISKTHFGVCAADEELDCRLPGLYVVNTDNSGSPGTHWLLVYVTAECNGHVFDSLGFIGMYRHRIIDSIHGQVFNTIEVPLQSAYSQLCGGYALYFARELAMGCHPKETVAIFSVRNVTRNDCFIQNYLWTNFGVHLSIT